MGVACHLELYYILALIFLGKCLDFSYTTMSVRHFARGLGFTAQFTTCHSRKWQLATVRLAVQRKSVVLACEICPPTVMISLLKSTCMENNAAKPAGKEGQVPSTFRLWWNFPLIPNTSNTITIMYWLSYTFCYTRPIGWSWELLFNGIITCKFGERVGWELMEIQKRTRITLNDTMDWLVEEQDWLSFLSSWPEILSSSSCVSKMPVT